MNTCDVVVVGGRVAGASTALLLARAGFRVVVLERSRPGADTVSTHALMRAGVLQLSRWGLLPQVVAAGTPPIRSTTFDYGDGGVTRVSIRPTPGVDALYAPRRTLLDRVLIEAAAGAGAEVHHGATVTALLRDGDAVCGVEVSEGHRPRRVIRAPLTIGADGIGSLVARDVAAAVYRQSTTASAILYHYVADLGADGYTWAYGGGAGAGVIPTNAGEACVFVATTPQRMTGLRAAGADGAFRRLLATAGPEVVDAVQAGTPTGRLHGWRGLRGYLRQPFGPGWALVGDAGYFRDPISTHGMTDALRDAELLADAVLAWHGGARPAAALAAYQATRDRLSDSLFSVTDAVAAYDWDADRLRGLLRRMSSAMSDEVDHLAARGAPAGSAGTGSPELVSGTPAAE